MSHGPAGEGQTAEPNLVPLLDMVMQLLMFFMINVNFVSQQVNANIELPEAEAARPMNKDETDVLFLNLNRDGYLEVTWEGAPLKTLDQMSLSLKERFNDLKRLSDYQGKGGKVETNIIIRADRNVDYGLVFNLMKKCQEIGFTHFQLRAMTRAG